MHIRKHYYAYFIVLVTAAFGGVGMSQADEIEKYVIKTGTLEPVPLPKYGYLFVSGSEERFFDMGPNGRSIRGTFGMDDLIQGGFKLDNGKRYLRDGEKGGELERRAASENPGSKVVAMLFRGEAGNILEVKVKGKTPVYRIDIKIGDREVTLWANVEKVDDPPPKEPLKNR